ncbi:MAG TPA: GTPase HflX [Candidatus Kapabacteria bacterium]|nr:GTPase HflX [Candidatus Kapabacteria bacterium]
MTDLEFKPERSIIVGFFRKGFSRELAREHIDELIFLADTAGAVIIEEFIQELAKPIAGTQIGTGKVEEIALYIKENNITMAIFDEDLTPIQVRNLEKAFEVKVIDRSGLILDIFTKRARTNEAQTQVELAQLQYLMPRLTRMWTHLSKQFGGVGTKGPGETQIETDRRMIRIKIQQLKEKLKEIDKQREVQRKNRNQLPRFALVGYTNSGKSTLMKLLTDSDVYVENKLFATLDTTVRQFELPSGLKALLSDTVGFIRKLPTHLVASFRSTLSEAKEADILIHVIDISNPFFRDHINTVIETLNSLEIVDKPTILVFNKIDLIENNYIYTELIDEFREYVPISALKGMNISTLLDKMIELYNQNSKDYKLLIPYTKMDLLPYIFNNTEILEREDTDEGIALNIRLKDINIGYFTHKFSEYLK